MRWLLKTASPMLSGLGLSVFICILFFDILQDVKQTDLKTVRYWFSILPILHYPISVLLKLSFWDCLNSASWYYQVEVRNSAVQGGVAEFLNSNPTRVINILQQLPLWLIFYIPPYIYKNIYCTARQCCLIRQNLSSAL